MRSFLLENGASPIKKDINYYYGVMVVAYFVVVNSDGTLNNNNANYSNGVAPD